MMLYVYQAHLVWNEKSSKWFAVNKGVLMPGCKYKCVGIRRRHIYI